MHRETLIACAPYVVGIVSLLFALALLLRCAGGRLQLAQLKKLHRDQAGAVQSLSFIITLPVFLLIMLFVVQLSLITMARISVEYAAYAAARSAVVWIPANLGTGEYAENRVGPWPIAPMRMYESDGRNYVVYQVVPAGDKFAQVHLAAAMACMPISPSANTGSSSSHPWLAALPSIEGAYQVLAPGSMSNTRVPTRLRNKWMYALENTQVAIEIHHCGDEISGGDPPLYSELPLENRFPRRYIRPNEVGWQDQVYVTVMHDYALLPVAGRLLTRRELLTPKQGATPGSDPVSSQIRNRNGGFVRSLVATVRFGNEGQKATPTIGDEAEPRSYVHPLPWGGGIF